MSLDFLRPVLIGAILLSGLLLLIAWEQEHAIPPQTAPAGQQTAQTPAAQGAPALPSPQAADARAASAPQDTAADGPATTGLELQRTADAPGPAAPDERQQPQDDGRYYSFSTDTLLLRLNLDGGGIDRAELPPFPLELETPETPVRLLDRLGPYEYYTRQGYQTPDGRLVRLRFEPLADGTDPDGSRQLQLRHTEPGAFVLTRSLTIAPGDFLVRIRDSIRNLGGAPLTLHPFAATYHNGETPPSGLLLAAPSYTGGAYLSSDQSYEKHDFGDMEDDPLRQSVRGGWVALVQHYFVSAWVPDPQAEHLYQLRHSRPLDLHVLGVASPPLTLPPGAESAHETSLWIGPKDQERLAQIARRLDLTVDYGWLWWIGQPIYVLISWIHDLVGNWGLAIILFTLLLKIAIYPLSAAGFRSMAKMRLLAPEMERLKARFGEDRQRMAQETMALYKREGVNPLGGCLPLLIPMPIFLALYWVLLESVELRQAPFFLWVQDLSAHDPYFVLPVLMGGSMWLTQKMSPTPPNMDPIMARVMQFMPLIFTVFLLAFPAGLVLYWLVNNVLSVAQQWWIQRSIARSR